MDSFFLLLCFLCFPFSLVSCAPFVEFVYPNFSTSFFQYIDRSGHFLLSPNGTFSAAIRSPDGSQQLRSYLCVIHTQSNTVVWSANRDAPISTSGKMNFTSAGIRIAEVDGSLKWSTPVLHSPAAALRLTEEGNLVVLNKSNETLWQSFDHPTDTIVIGQGLASGNSLSSAVSKDNFATGDYKLSLVGPDAVLQWQGLTYWRFSMEKLAFRDSSYVADFLIVNGTGLYLLGLNRSVGVTRMEFPASGLRFVKLDYTGQLIVTSFSGADSKVDFLGPGDSCRIPYICGKLGLCNSGASAMTPVCSCPSNFKEGSHNTSICVPSDPSYSLPSLCRSINGSMVSNSWSSSVSYVHLARGVNYFTNDFVAPSRYGVNFSACQDLCSRDCNCPGFFFENSSGSCSVLGNRLGSFMLTNNGNSANTGYIKVVVRPESHGGGSKRFPLAGLVVLPFAGVFLLVALGYLLWRRSRVPQLVKTKRVHSDSSSSGDLEDFSIPGLPVRFEYLEIVEATEDFKTKIGSGGFGSVYKGIIPGTGLVAVKKMNNLGIQGRKEFVAEIAVIGNIHHVNLVKLIGYCAQGRHRLLIYEYMNRGSLDRSLFGGGPVLEWQERVEIALGAARGLTYLHTGCEHKIIHCDIKPENILLDDKMQTKLSDFGLSKLLSPEQSTLFTTMRGTRGYLAPEWLTSSAISDKTDVYSFGMVLFEIVSGRKNCPTQSRSHSLEESSSCVEGSSSSSGQEHVYFPSFALQMHEHKRYLELADSRLEGRVTSQEVEKLIRVALCCVQEEPSLRPSMVNVVGMLEGGVALSEPKIESLNFLKFYGLRFSEASMAGGSQMQIDAGLYLQTESTPPGSTRSESNALLSFISSQQISGPR